MELRKKVLLIVMVPLISSQSAYTFPFVTVLEHFCLNWQEVNINLILNVEQGQEDALLQAFHQEFKNCNGRTMGFMDSRNKGRGSSMDLKSLEDFEKTITFFIEDGATSQHIPDTDLNRGIWIIPQEYVQELDPYKLRLDSQIYYFSTVGLDTFEISEIYSIKGQKSVKRVTEMLSMSQATPGGHLHPSNQELFWERRSNLSGITLQGRSKTYRQYSKLKMFNKTHVESTSGMFLDIMDIMQEKMGFEIVYQVPADGQWGALNPNTGNWTGMVGELMDGSADVVVTGLSLNNERARVIDYSTVIYTTEIGLLIRKPGSNQPNLWAYLFIFTLDTWMLIVAAIVVLGINYFCVNSTKIKSNRHKHEGRGIQNYIALVFLAMLQLEYPITIKNVSSRTLHLSTWFFAYLIFAFYTADLTSRLTVLPEAESFASLEEATEKGYKLILLKGANGHVIFSSAAEGTPRHKIWKEVIEPNPELLAKDREEAMNLLLTKEKHAYFSSYTNDERLVVKPIIDGQKGRTALAFQKDSEFTKLFSYHLSKLHQAGVIQNLAKHYFDPDPAPLPSDQNLEEAFVLGYDTLLFPFVALGSGLIGSMGLIFYELIAKKCACAAIVKTSPTDQ